MADTSKDDSNGAARCPAQNSNMKPDDPATDDVDSPSDCAVATDGVERAPVLPPTLAVLGKICNMFHGILTDFLVWERAVFILYIEHRYRLACDRTVVVCSS